MKLTGITCLDLSLFLPGPTVTQMMADHGARVIKIESLGEGEPNRHIGQKRDGESVYFTCTHRGKESLTLNLKDPDGLEIFMALARSADVVVESFRPGVVERLGVDYASVARIRPEIVYASISAYGQSGPLASDPAHDLAVEAMCGLLSNNVDAHDRPVMPAMPAGDMLAATLTLSGILMALYRREQTGAGDYLDVAMMDSILACMPNSMGAAFADGVSPVPRNERIWGGNALYRIYETSDGGHIALGGSEIKFARNLLTALGREDLIPLCELPPGPDQLPVVAFLTDTFAGRTREEWVRFFAGLDVCFAPVNDLRTGLDLPQTRHREMCIEDNTGREHLGTPLKFATEPARLRLEAPAHGEHTDAILAELGYGAADREGLRARGVV
ncbi:MAG: CaiB/BaiF CoA-transferase family protein [Pseudomonadales bacterium]|jgi:crotonobetainyl-CoA:carnitine CoA-transferase CaiB-like acyl-CoA transferase